MMVVQWPDATINSLEVCMNHAQNHGRQLPPGEQWTWRIDGRVIHEEPEYDGGRDCGSDDVP